MRILTVSAAVRNTHANAYIPYSVRTGTAPHTTMDVTLANLKLPRVACFGIDTRNSKRKSHALLLSHYCEVEMSRQRLAEPIHIIKNEIEPINRQSQCTRYPQGDKLPPPRPPRQPDPNRRYAHGLAQSPARSRPRWEGSRSARPGGRRSGAHGPISSRTPSVRMGREGQSPFCWSVSAANQVIGADRGILLKPVPNNAFRRPPTANLDPLALPPLLPAENRIRRPPHLTLWSHSSSTFNTFKVSKAHFSWNQTKPKIDFTVKPNPTSQIRIRIIVPT
jgi:hypothetical protein